MIQDEGEHRKSVEEKLPTSQQVSITMKLKLSLLIFCDLVLLIGCQSLLDDTLMPVVKLTRMLMANLVGPSSFDVGYQTSARNSRVQPEYKNQNFFCNVTGAGKRSKTIPTSVHRLTPGDIDIVGAIGDSLTAANGAFASDSLQTMLEGRGVSWSIGGRDNWRKFITLPNLLKEFNPKLYGFSTAANSLGFQKKSKFNVAEPGAISGHTIRQVKNLVKRMRTDSKVDIENHWKLITIMIGSNDFCFDICYHHDQEKLIKQAENDMIKVLRIIRDNLPRTLVNVVLPIDASIILKFKKMPDECQGFHYLECPCLSSPSQTRHLNKTLSTIKRWKVMLKEQVVDLPEFHNRNDFEVNLMKFTDRINLSKPDGSTDYTFLSWDCFHFSQKGHMFTAIQFWNAMLTADNERSNYSSREMFSVKCPSEKYPFIRTKYN